MSIVRKFGFGLALNLLSELSSAQYVSELFFENKLKEDVEVVARWERDDGYAGWEKYTKVRPGQAVKFNRQLTDTGNGNSSEIVNYKNLDVYTRKTKTNHHMSADIEGIKGISNAPETQVWEAALPGTTFRLRKVYRDAPTKVGNSSYVSGFSKRPKPSGFLKPTLAPNFVHRVIVKNNLNERVSIKVDYTVKVDGQIKHGSEEWDSVAGGQAVAFKKNVKKDGTSYQVWYNMLTIDSLTDDDDFEVIKIEPQSKYYGIQEQYITVEKPSRGYSSVGVLRVQPVNHEGKYNNYPNLSVLDNAWYHENTIWGNDKVLKPPTGRDQQYWFQQWWHQIMHYCGWD